MSDLLLPGVASAKRRAMRTVFLQIAIICAFAATATLATNIFLPSLPKMADALDVSSAAATSAITVYLAILAVGQLIVGPLSDRFGRRPVNLIGLCIFIVGTIWCALAADLSNLLIGRSIQAAGACAASVLSRAIARDLFDGQMLAKVMALITIATLPRWASRRFSVACSTTGSAGGRSSFLWRRSRYPRRRCMPPCWVKPTCPPARR